MINPPNQCICPQTKIHLNTQNKMNTTMEQLPLKRQNCTTQQRISLLIILQTTKCTNQEIGQPNTANKMCTLPTKCLPTQNQQIQNGQLSRMYWNPGNTSKRKNQSLSIFMPSTHLSQRRTNSKNRRRQFSPTQNYDEYQLHGGTNNIY